jgi:potassium-transporting ATPase KdpC subunit
VEALRAADPGSDQPISTDLVTASGSGLDPHISVAAAEYQIPRIARSRGMKETDVRTLVAKNTHGPDFGVFGERVVNVQELNLDLDRAKAR